MLSAAITTLLTLIQALLPQIGVSSQVVATILSALIQLVPIIAQEATDLLGPVKNIIQALSNSGAATPDQIAALQALDAQVDAAFEAAATAAGAPDDPAAAVAAQ